MKGRFLVFSLIGILLAAAPLFGAPGDVLRRVPLLTGCFGATRGLSFDGKLIYYTHAGEPLTGRIHKFDVGTGAYAGMLQVTRSAVPVAETMLGLEFDPNRSALWASASGRVYLVSLQTGEILRTIDLLRPPGGAWDITYDPVLDIIWETNGSESGLQAWHTDGNFWTSIGLPADRGLAFDGVDLWHVTPSWMAPPAPNSEGYIYPTDLIATIDYGRLLDPPGIGYVGAAYDCMTFPSRALWVGNDSECELIAFEVQSAAPCPSAPPRRLLRTAIRDTDLEPGGQWRNARLPVVTTTTDRIYRIEGTLQFDDREDRILEDTSRPLVLYRLLDALDGDQGNILRLRKGPLAPSILASE